MPNDQSPRGHAWLSSVSHNGKGVVFESVKQASERLAYQDAQQKPQLQ